MKWKVVVSIFLVILVAGFFVLKYYSGILFESPQSFNKPSQTAQDQIPQTITVKNEDAVLSQTDAAINQSMDQLDKDLQNAAAISQEDDPNSL